MTISDSQLLLFLITIPVFSAIFVSCVPHFDMSSVRQIATTILIVWLAFLLKCGHALSHQVTQLSWHFNFSLWLDNNILSLSLGQLQLVLLLALWCALFSLFFLDKHTIENNGLSFTVVTLLLLALSTLAILSDTPAISIVTASLSLFLFLYLVARFGGTQKGQAILLSSLFFLAVDLCSISALFLPKTIWQSQGFYLYWIALTPALARLLIPFFAPFYRILFNNCSIAIIILYIAFMVPTGAALLFQLKSMLLLYQPMTILNPIVSILVFGSVLFSAFWAISEKDPRQLGLTLLVFYNAIFISFALAPIDEYLTKLSTYLLFCTIICASFTLFVGQLLFVRHGPQLNNMTINHLWLAGLAIWFPLPGFGMGTPFWLGYTHLLTPTFLSPALHVLFWLIVFLLLTTALVQNYFRHTEPQNAISSIAELRSRTLPSFKYVWTTFTIVLLLCFVSSTYFLNAGA